MRSPRANLQLRRAQVVLMLAVLLPTIAMVAVAVVLLATSAGILAGLVVTGDRPTLVRALVNLLTNAWKYTGEDKRIEVAAVENRRWIDITVRDNGAGIDPAEQSQIFEQFQRGRAADLSGATGLGLG